MHEIRIHRLLVRNKDEYSFILGYNTLWIFTQVLTYRSEVLLAKLVVQLVKKFPARSWSFSLCNFSGYLFLCLKPKCLARHPFSAVFILCSPTLHARDHVSYPHKRAKISKITTFFYSQMIFPLYCSEWSKVPSCFVNFLHGCWASEASELNIISAVLPIANFDTYIGFKVFQRLAFKWNKIAVSLHKFFISTFSFNLKIQYIL